MCVFSMLIHMQMFYRRQFVLYGMFVAPGRKPLVTWFTLIEPKEPLINHK